MIYQYTGGGTLKINLLHKVDGRMVYFGYKHQRKVEKIIFLSQRKVEKMIFLFQRKVEKIIFLFQRKVEKGDQKKTKKLNILNIKTRVAKLCWKTHFEG